MSEQDYNISIDDTKIALILLQILRKKEKINEQTYSNTVRIYMQKLREVA